MIRINQIKLNLNEDEDKLLHIIAKKLRYQNIDKIEYQIVKKSIDARKKDDIKIVYSVDVTVPHEKAIIKRINEKNILLTMPQTYQYVSKGRIPLTHRPVIVGTGPAGLFCGYMLAKYGYRPIMIERGEDVDNRTKSVNALWENNQLNPESNVQFGEGGAGAFSDGKLNTLVNDKLGRNGLVLNTFVEFGAPSDILYDNKPHIGTDILRDTIKNMRNKIISMGGEVLFNTKLTDIVIENGAVSAIEINSKTKLSCDVLVLALGHSARDTFTMLYQNNIIMEAKSFAVGIRIEHPQKMINESQYGHSEHPKLPQANYKLATKSLNGRSVYSFCMCPGGYVVNASSEKGHLAVNGMSYSERDSNNANSAIVVSVTPDDFFSKSPLDGIKYQQDLEKSAFAHGKGNIPVQLFGDFLENIVSEKFGEFDSCVKGNTTFANLKEILPKEISAAIQECIPKFGRVIEGYDRPDAIMSGIESRTSSPIRIMRNEHYECNIAGVYPCGEGAGYAGGITSAAMDGIKVFEGISDKFESFIDKK